MEIDKANIGNLTDGLVMDKTVLGELTEMDDDLAGDLASDGDKDNQASGGGCSGDRQFDNCQQRN